MTTTEIAAKLYELCNQNQFEQAVNELFADDAKSIEPPHSQGLQTVQGKAAIKAKGDLFQESVEAMHGGYLKEPLVFGNYIFMEMGMDCTMKGMGRTEMNELCKYEVKDGKIISEEFFY